ncbi:uncharacterized protein LOC144716403 [Wolffia australiana]
MGPSQGNNILHAIFAAESLQGILNEEQRQLYDAVFEAIQSTKCGTEAKIKASRRNAISIGTSGITSASMIIVDEAPMMHRHVYEMLDRSNRDVMKSVDARLESFPFGSKVVVMGGDFRQMLLVILKGSRPMIVSLSLNQSDVWRHCSIFCLQTNVCILPDQQVWSEFLLAVREGHVGPDVDLPAEIQCVSPLLELIARVYDTFEDGTTQLTAKTILMPLNDDMVKVNNMVLDVFPRELMEYFSFDVIPLGEVDNESLYPTEFLNTIDDVTMPLHKL